MTASKELAVLAKAILELSSSAVSGVYHDGEDVTIEQQALSRETIHELQRIVDV